MRPWIEFGPPLRSLSKKTFMWSVYAKDGGAWLGTIKWHGAWRCYAFFPEPKTLFESDCLTFIAAFARDKTREQKAEAKEARKLRRGKATE